MNKLDHQSFWKEKDGKECRADIYLSNNFSKLKNVAQVYGIILDPGRSMVLLARHKNNKYTLPGGHVEKGETLIQTLLREIKEETNKDVYGDKIIPFFYQIAFIKENDKWIECEIQVRYITIVKNNNKFISDPDGDIVENKWIKIDELDKYLNWGHTTEIIIKKLKNILK
ncbi:MAG TPA: NUDIX hydrolase [bacterium]|nr:NUDIX hydrolase [bacterium]